MTCRPPALRLGALVALAIVACQSGRARALERRQGRDRRCSEAGLLARRRPRPRRAPVLFVVTNTGADVAEFEIIGAGPEGHRRGREHRPGLRRQPVQRGSTAATYELVCGTLTSPRGALTVTGGAGRDPPAERGRRRRDPDAASSPSTTPTCSGRPTTSSRSSTRSRTAIDAGDLEAAKAAYGPVARAVGAHRADRRALHRPRPKIDAREDDFDQAGVDDPGVHRLPPHREGPLRRRHDRRPRELTAGLRATSPTSRRGSPTLDDRPAGHGPGRRRAHRRGRPVEDDRRGGPLLEARPLVDRPERRGLGQDRRPPAAGHRQKLDPATSSASTAPTRRSTRSSRSTATRRRASRPSTRSARPTSRRSRPGWPACRSCSPSSPAAWVWKPSTDAAHGRRQAPFASRLPRRFGRRRHGRRGRRPDRGGRRLRAGQPGERRPGDGNRSRATSRSTAPHQAGIVTPGRPQPAALFVAMDAVVTSKPELVTALTDLTARSRQLTVGLGAGRRRPALPAAGERHHRRDRRPVRPDHHGRVRRFAVRRAVRARRRRSRSSSTRMPDVPQRPARRRRAATATCCSRSARRTRPAASTPCAT